MLETTNEINKILLGNNRAKRLYLCEREPFLFAYYYFTEYFFYEPAPFHEDFFEDCKELATGKIDEALWVAFRESSKTSIAKIALAAWCICYAKKKYINWDSYDGDNSEAALFDIALALQTNTKILRDFGHLYWEDRAGYTQEGIKESKLKRISNFITRNGVRVEAHTTQESTRGRVFGERRPDLYILDDIENFKTKDSLLLTQKIIAHIDELRAGKSQDTAILYLGNYITNAGVIEYLRQLLKKNKKAKERFIPVIINGKPAWPAKYVLTDEEALKANRNITDPKLRKISLQSKERELRTPVFQTEMMNAPEKAGDMIFTSRRIKELIEKCSPPSEIIAGLKLWEKYNPSHRYAIGSDSAEGVMLDSCASVIIDLTIGKVVGTFEDNEIKPDIFGAELARQGKLFGICLTAPEINHPGTATLVVLQQLYPEEKIYKRSETEFGFKTTAANKGEIIYNLRTAVEDGILEIPDKDLLEEMLAYTVQDLRQLGRKLGMTRHFDKLMACAIAWEMRNYLKIEPARERLEQERIEQNRRERAGALEELL